MIEPVMQIRLPVSLPRLAGIESVDFYNVLETKTKACQDAPVSQASSVQKRFSINKNKHLYKYISVGLVVETVWIDHGYTRKLRHRIIYYPLIHSQSPTFS